ncbi:MAG: hypothetical protein MZU79_04710 [Anaerotruncus sp.]|nr:hypothetical protein [Anaerotruncus sp.]
MTKPVLAILDEPTSGLDVINALEVREIVRRYVKEGTSDPALVPQHARDRVHVRPGRPHRPGPHPRRGLAGRAQGQARPGPQPRRGLQEFPPMKRFGNLLRKELKEPVTKRPHRLPGRFTVLLFQLHRLGSSKEGGPEGRRRPDHLGSPGRGRLSRRPRPCSSGPRVGRVQDPPRPVGQDQGRGPRAVAKAGESKLLPGHPQGLRRVPGRARSRVEIETYRCWSLVSQLPG